LHVLYILNIHIKIHSNWMLITIQSINIGVFFMHNFKTKKKLKLKNLIDDITIDF